MRHEAPEYTSRETWRRRKSARGNGAGWARPMNRASDQRRTDCTRRIALVCAAMWVFATLDGPAIAHEPASGSEEGCALSARSAPRAVVRVIDGATLALDDGTQVRLIGALAPTSLDVAPTPGFRDERGGDGHEQNAASSKPPTTGSASDSWQPAVAARQALEKLVEGHSVTLATAGRPRDRYGRMLAHVFVDRVDGGAVWLQGAMLAAGHARAYGMPDNFACMDALLAAEAPARGSGRGLWANPAYSVRSAAHTQILKRLRGTYQIVAGRVHGSQRAKSGWIYINFGSRWRFDFSASIAPGISRAHPAWAARLLDLKGRQVRVRGWIELRNGPSINIEHPSQLDIIDTATPARSAPPAMSAY